MRSSALLALLLSTPARADWPLPWTLADARPADARTDGATQVYDDVYPGVRLTVESRRDALTYRFDIAPGADPARIRMHYPGDVHVDDSGRALEIHTTKGTLRESGLRCFQDIDGSEHNVPCGYRIDARRETISFALATYDRTRALAVDPEISWSSFLGGNGAETGADVAVDASGNVYVVGRTDSTDLPSLGGFDTSLGGTEDAFVAKIDAGSSSLLWSSYLGGNGNDDGRGIAVDSANNVYVVGETNSTDFPSTGGFDTTLGGLRDAFVAKVDASGTALAWSSYLGGDATDEEGGRAIAVDAALNVYVTGTTDSPTFPVIGGFDTSLGGGSDAFVAKVMADGSALAWSSYLGGSGGLGLEFGNALAIDGAGNVYLTGSTESSDFPIVGGFDDTLGMFEDAFVTKVNADGASLAWSTYLGGSSGDDKGADIAVDGSGNVYVTGETRSFDFPTPGGFDTAGDEDGFVARISADGSSLLWASYLGGDDYDAGFDLAIDAGGNVYVAGYTYSSDFPSGGGFDTGLDGTVDGFVARVDASGSSLAWSSYLGGSGDDIGRGVALTATGSLVVVGDASASPDFPTPGGFDTELDGFSDAFLVRIGVCGNGVCDDGETPCTCEVDCGADACGNGCCGPAETCATCDGDCGSCPEPAAEPAPMEPIPDAAADASGEPDAAADASDNSDAPTSTGGGSGGCACHVGPADGSLFCGLLLLMALLGASRRRARHRSRPRAP